MAETEIPLIDFGTPGSSSAGPQHVYVRQRWADWNEHTKEFSDVPWIPQPHLWCEYASWSALPGIPNARFTLDYGMIAEPGARGYEYRSKASLGGWYVKVVFDADDGQFSWYGFIDETIDEMGGRGGSPTGRQTFVANGMVQILAHEYITSAVWDDVDADKHRTSGSAIDFNAAGRPNRSTDTTHEDVFTFKPNLQHDASPQSILREPSDFWSSRDILNYLLKLNTPTDGNGNLRIPFKLLNDAAVVDWDQPTIATEGRSVLSLVNDLVNPNRLAQISTGVDTDVVPNAITLTVNSLTPAKLTLPNASVHPASKRLLTIRAVDSPDVSVVLQHSETQAVHQVIAKGAKRESMGTFHICDGSNPTDQAFIEAFDSSHVDEYNTAATASPEYQVLDDEQRQKMNVASRGRKKLEDVFRTFILNPQWEDWVLMFNATKPIDGLPFLRLYRYYPYWGDVTVAKHLPLKENVDYSQNGVSDTSESEYRPPYVLFEVPSQPGVYQAAEKIADGENTSWSVSVGVGKYGQALTLDVQGEQQHAIAEQKFVPNNEDYGDPSDYDYFDAMLTVSITDDRFAEAVHPEKLPDRDAIRKQLLYAGDAYRQVHLHNPDNTFPVLISDSAVIDVDSTGSPVRIHDKFKIDDTPALASIAEIAAAWHAQPRKMLRLNSARPSARLGVGQLVLAINLLTLQSDIVGTVITEITYSMPQSEGTLSAPAYTVTTAMGEFDPLGFIPEPSKA